MTWLLDERGGTLLLRCTALDRAAGVAHGFSTLRGSGDLGGSDDRSDEVEARRARFLAACGLDGRRPTILRQVHGDHVVDVAELAPDAPPEAADAAHAARPRAGGWVPAVRTADCVPLLLAERDGAWVAAVHAGWRGVAQGVVGAALAAFAEQGGAVSRLTAALGPAIGSCCYEVGPEVVEAVAGGCGLPSRELARRSKGRTTVDLRRAIGGYLERAGVDPAAIHVAPWCTRCAAELFHSFRRDGPGAGRQMACIGWSGGSSS